jgi:hypothetical protein
LLAFVVILSYSPNIGQLCTWAGVPCASLTSSADNNLKDHALILGSSKAMIPPGVIVTGSTFRKVFNRQRLVLSRISCPCI